MKILTYILILLSYSVSLAQSTTYFQGYVRDKTFPTILLDSANVRAINLDDSSLVFSSYTNANGFYSHQIVTSVLDFNPNIPSEFELGHNYPNPFNPSTRFNLTAVKSGKYQLSIFDVTGSKLYEETYELSTGSYVFDVSRLGSAGVKFYRIIADNKIETKGMIQLDGSYFNPSVAVYTEGTRTLKKMDNLRLRIIAAKVGYFSDSMDVTITPGGLYPYDFELRKISNYVLNAIVKVYNMKGDVVTNLDSMRWTWPDGSTENVPLVNGEMVLNKSFSSLNSDTSATVTPDRPELYLNWVIGTTNNSEKVEWLYQNGVPADSNDAKVPLNLINNKTTEQYLIQRFVMYGVNNDQPIDMSGPVVTQMLSRPPFGIVSSFKPDPYDTTYVFQFTFNNETGVPISQSNIDRAYNELDKVLSATVWSHKKLLNYEFHRIDSKDDPLWQYVFNGPRNQENFSFTTFGNLSPRNSVTISLDGSYRIKNSNSKYTINNTIGQIQAEVFDSFCNTNIDGGEHLIAIYLPGAPSTDLAKTLIGITHIMKARTSYWNQ